MEYSSVTIQMKGTEQASCGTVYHGEKELLSLSMNS